ncbi:hypothetical protein BDN70DRAFT_855524 [Pholiota conissans]|uniref:Uncharacterized protein n=1 Tax=Pholiota conissans TaxID=109636 RepID=A0A9P6D280_9AGAR|nr:hypothetical protein BDN70DRAFT_855524 [Pholiota conissans]
MAARRYYADPKLRPKLDPTLFALQENELDFFRTLTGIQDDDKLKEHILAAQAKAYDVYGYPCIRSFGFTKLKIARIDPGYKNALRLLKERKNPILLDIACCFGNDARKAVLDGWPVENVIASDLQQGFWDAGHDLFNSTPETFPAAFVPGDVFDPAMLKPRGAFITEEDIASIPTTTPPLKELTSLTPLQGKISAIHASSFFHLFQEDKQLELAHLLASLLSPEKGSVIFGQHGARPIKGYRTEAIHVQPLKDEDGNTIPPVQMFCHSPESWKELWTEQIFAGPDGKGSERIKVDTQLVEVFRKDLHSAFLNYTEDMKFYLMSWCITRL